MSCSPVLMFRFSTLAEMMSSLRSAFLCRWMCCVEFVRQVSVWYVFGFKFCLCSPWPFMHSPVLIRILPAACFLSKTNCKCDSKWSRRKYHMSLLGWRWQSESVSSSKCLSTKTSPKSCHDFWMTGLFHISVFIRLLTYCLSIVDNIIDLKSTPR